MLGETVKKWLFQSEHEHYTNLSKSQLQREDFSEWWFMNLVNSQ